MKAHWAGIAALLFATQSACCADAAVPPVAKLIEAMKAAQMSEGFEARLSVKTASVDPTSTEPVKIAVVGQFDASGQRLLIRGLSPQRIRDRFVVAERQNDGHIRALAYGPGNALPPYEIGTESMLFDTRLVVWDMFAPWWSWPSVTTSDKGTIAGRDCVGVRSRAPVNALQTMDSAVREVQSCVDRDGGLAMKVQLLNGSHASLRTWVVTRWFRKASGLLAAKASRMTANEGTESTEVEVYDGDENHRIAAGTFDVLRMTQGRGP